MKIQTRFILLFISIPILLFFYFTIPKIGNIKKNESLNNFLNQSDIVSLGQTLRKFATIHKHTNDWIDYGKILQYALQESNDPLQFENNLFSWLKPTFKSSFHIRDTFKGNGIVMYVNNNLVNDAYTNLKIIRIILQCHLPIQIFYIGIQDLSSNNIIKLNSIHNITFQDITLKFNNDILKLSSNNISPFMILASKFQNTLLLKSNVILLHSPQHIFNSNTFFKYHSYFFQYQTIKENLNLKISKDWIHSILVHPLRTKISKFRLLNEQSDHQLDDSVMLIDKKHHITALLVVCLLHIGQISNQVVQHTHGHKETFWIGFEVIGSLFGFNPVLPGMGGVITRNQNKTFICNEQVLQSDEHQRPLYFRGNFQEDIKYENYFYESGNESLWSSSGSLNCLELKKEPFKFDLELISRIEDMKSLIRQLLDE
ncbi:mannosyltransferase putative-domain-containing protein [Globomyces pollinis-pini]|nr:mannosyltransferase putative-domain-containing protein [Globomyces pollinis-pini]